MQLYNSPDHLLCPAVEVGTRTRFIEITSMETIMISTVFSSRLEAVELEAEEMRELGAIRAISIKL